MPATHFTSIYHIIALHILHFMPTAKDFTNYYTLFPLHYKQLRPWEFCSLDDPWSFTASNSLMHSIHRCTCKSLQFFIIMIMMATFMRGSQKLVFHQSKGSGLAPSSIYSIPGFFKENVRYLVWTCKDPICLTLGTQFI